MGPLYIVRSAMMRVLMMSAGAAAVVAHTPAIRLQLTKGKYQQEKL